MAGADRAAGTKVAVQVGGRMLTLSNLDKPLYADGTTKGEVIAYYTGVAPALLPHLAGRPLTVRRWPDGTSTDGFYEKNLSRTAPAWVRRATLPTPGSTKDRGSITYVVVEDLATLVWVANLAGLELHVPQWRLDDADRPQPPDRLVVDLDPGPPADLLTCCRVAMTVRAALTELGLDCVPKTSGNKGMQLYARLDQTQPWTAVRDAAKALAEQLERQDPLVVSRMDKHHRRGKVLLDWSQNHAGKTTVAPYSLRGTPLARPSAPLQWSEVERALADDEADSLRFSLQQVQQRWQQDGDLLADLVTEG